MVSRDTYKLSRLKRSKTSIGDLADLDTDLGCPPDTSPPSPARPIAQRPTRPSRGVSLTKLTSSLGFSTSRRPSIEKSSISKPILDPQNPIVLPSPSLPLGEVSPPPGGTLSSPYTSPYTPTKQGYPFPKDSEGLSSSGHLYSVSEPATSRRCYFPYPPTRPAPQVPRLPGGHNLSRAPETPLNSIVESPAETDNAFGHDKLNCQELTSRLQALTNMDPSRLSLQPSGMSTKARAIQQAKDMQALVAERVKRSGEEAPPYDFFELIGKGTYGRVFKGLNRNTGALVAIKIIDIDKEDYEQMSTSGLSDTLREINVLQQVGDSRARPYVNIIEDARPVHSELWIVSEYASGGSVSTLMKPTMGTKNPGLEEKFIIPIARELAMGLKYIHEAGVLHRDLKCNNVLILEDGRVQLCDFGVSNMLEPAKSKRSTIVGTPNWMAPELQKEYVKAEESRSMDTPTDLLYGSEVDIWAYGCTVYEMATGLPPHARVQAFDLPNAGVPALEGDRFSQELKDFLAFVLQPEPENRPTPDEILEHPYLANSTKKYPTAMLVKLVEDYYKWEQDGGARVSLFNPYGAQAPAALVASDDDDDDDWTFSTSDEFENRLSRAFPDPFTAPGPAYNGMSVPPENDDRWEKMKAAWHEESISRGAKKLNRLFDPNSTPYRYSGVDGGNGRPPSDLILRDFNPGAPNRETFIDLDFAAPMASDVPIIDLDEVPTLKANRMQKLLREAQMEDEERELFDMDNAEKRATMDWKFSMGDDQDQTARRATRDWKFPMADDQTVKRATKDWKFPMADDQTARRDTRDWKFPSMTEQSNRQTKDFQFPPKPNRVTREWTFSAAMAEANYNQRNSRRETRDWKFPTVTDQPVADRKTRDFKFPMSDPVEEDSGPGQNLASSPTLDPDFRPHLRHASTEPVKPFTAYPKVNSAPESPMRTSMIDLDMAMPDNDYRPSTADSSETTIRTAVSEQLNDNPFNLEDQVQLSQKNNRASYHTKSQSEPNHAIAGLLTPQTFDEQGQPTNPDLHHPNMHARGVSSVSQMQAQLKPPVANNGVSQHRPYQRSQQLAWEGWSHSAAYGIGSDESPPMSVATDQSADEDDVDEAWDALEQQFRSQGRHRTPGIHRMTPSRDDDLRSSDIDDADYDDFSRLMRVSLGPNGKPLVEFPIPRGPDPEALLGISGVGGGDAGLSDALWKSTLELRDGTRAARDLMKAMRLEDVKPFEEENVDEEGSGGGDDAETVRLG